MAAHKLGGTYKKEADDAHQKAMAQMRGQAPAQGAPADEHISTASRKRSATVVQKNRQGGQKYRFPMPDKAHARAALQDLPKAKGLSSADKTKIRSRANRMLGKNDQ